jgi:hypothetical protein
MGAEHRTTAPRHRFTKEAGHHLVLVDLPGIHLTLTLLLGTFYSPWFNLTKVIILIVAFIFNTFIVMVVTRKIILFFSIGCF